MVIPLVMLLPHIPTTTTTHLQTHHLHIIRLKKKNMATRALSIEDANLRSTSTVTTTQNKEYSDLDISLAVKDTTGDVYKKLSAESVKFAVKNLL